MTIIEGSGQSAKPTHTVPSASSSRKLPEKEKKSERVKSSHENRACETFSTNEESDKENLRPSDDEQSICKSFITLHLGYVLNVSSSALLNNFQMGSAGYSNVNVSTMEGHTKPKKDPPAGYDSLDDVQPAPSVSSTKKNPPAVPKEIEENPIEAT